METIHRSQYEGQSIGAGTGLGTWHATNIVEEQCINDVPILS